MKTPRFLIAPDSFKNCLTAQQAGTAIQRGILKVFPDAVVTVIPMADGGEGTVDAVLASLGGERVEVDVVDSFLRSHKAFLGSTVVGINPVKDLSFTPVKTLRRI